VKSTLEFDLPEEKDDLDDALNGSKYKVQIDELWNRLFRPRHKHGYHSQELNMLMMTEVGEKIMDELEEIYNEVIND
jgi:hypothetical protein